MKHVGGGWYQLEIVESKTHLEAALSILGEGELAGEAKRTEEGWLPPKIKGKDRAQEVARLIESMETEAELHKQPPPKLIKEKAYENVGAQAVEISHGKFLKPGESTKERPHNLSFYLQIGAIRVVDAE